MRTGRGPLLGAPSAWPPSGSTAHRPAFAALRAMGVVDNDCVVVASGEPRAGSATDGGKRAWRGDDGGDGNEEGRRGATMAAGGGGVVGHGAMFGGGGGGGGAMLGDGGGIGAMFGGGGGSGGGVLNWPWRAAAE